MDLAELEELFESLGPVTVRRMFGGQGIYRQGVILALILRDGELRLKGDALTAPALEAAGSVRWTYQRPGKAPAAMPYWSVPPDAYDDPEEMARWVRLAWEAALRAHDGEPGGEPAA